MIGFLFGFLAGVLTCAWFPGFPRWVRGAWAVVGLKLQQGVAGVRPATPNIPIRARENYAKAADVTGHIGPISGASGSHMTHWGRALSNLAGFFWRHKRLILICALFLLGSFALKGCGTLPWSKSRDALALEARLAQAEARLQQQLNARDAEIARISQEAALNRQRLAYLASQGHSEIEAARPANEAPLDPQLSRAWRAGIERLRNDAGADADRADPAGSGA